ncbi:hypothetical protein Emag_000291 [Eimeria magna]
MRAFSPQASRATSRPWATIPGVAAPRDCSVGGRHAALPMATAACTNNRSTSSSNNRDSSKHGLCIHLMRLFVSGSPASITRALYPPCAVPPVRKHSRGASTAAEWGNPSWEATAGGAFLRRHEGGSPTVRILAAMPTAELCWRLCEEERGEALSANLTSRILDALRGPQGTGQMLSSKGSSLGCPAHERGWIELRAELHEALELLFEDGGLLPRSLAELRIGAPGEGQAEAVVPGEEEAAQEQGAALERRRRPRSPELIFEVLSPQAFASAAPKQQRKAAQDAFLSVVEELRCLSMQHADSSATATSGVVVDRAASAVAVDRAAAAAAAATCGDRHFVLRPCSAEAVNLDKLLPIVGPIRFLELLPLLVQRQQAEDHQQPHEGEHQQQGHHHQQQAKQQQQRRILQQLRSRLSPASLGALLRSLCEAQGPSLFEGPKIFAACWAAESPQRGRDMQARKHVPACGGVESGSHSRLHGELKALKVAECLESPGFLMLVLKMGPQGGPHVGQLSDEEGLKALASPLEGTGVSWRFLLDVAQRRQSEPFLLHLFECMDSYELKKAAAAALAEKHPLTGQLLDPWGFMMSRRLSLHSASGHSTSSFVTASDGSPRSSTNQGTGDQWSSPIYAGLAALTSPCRDKEAKALPADAHNIGVRRHSGSSGGIGNTDSTCSGTKITTSSAGNSRSGLSLPEGFIRFLGSASEIGECFEFLRRGQQQQARLIMTQSELRELLSHVGSGGDASCRSLAYKLARHRRLSLGSLQAHAAEASGSESLMTGTPTEERSGPPSLSFFSPEEEGGTLWKQRGGPHGDFLFPLEMGEECGCAALLPLAVGLRVIGAPPYPASLLCLSVSSRVLVIDLLNRQQAHAAAVCRLLQWLLPNPLIVKVLFDSGDTLQRLALGPFSTQEGSPLGTIVHAIDLRQPRVYRVVRAPSNQPGPLVRDAQLAEALTRGDEALLRDVLKRQQERQQQHEQQQKQEERGLETEIQILTIGTRRTLSELAQAVLGAEAPAASGRLTRSGNPNRRPLDLQDMQDAANEAFSLLLIERKLRQTMLMPKSILGGSGVHALLFGNLTETLYLIRRFIP